MSGMRVLPLQHPLKTLPAINHPVAAQGRYLAQQRIRRKSTALLEYSDDDSSNVRYPRHDQYFETEKGLQCHCGRLFIRLESLQRHQKKHAQENTLACGFDGCDMTFVRVDLLQQHQDRHRKLRSTFNQARIDALGETAASTGHSQTFTPAAAHGLFPIPFQSRHSAVAETSTKGIKQKVRNARMFIDYSHRKRGPSSRVNHGSKKRVHYTVSQDNTESQVQCVKTQRTTHRQERNLAARAKNFRVSGKARFRPLTDPLREVFRPQPGSVQSAQPLHQRSFHEVIGEEAPPVTGINASTSRWMPDDCQLSRRAERRNPASETGAILAN
ncbi:hypothetical protein FB567DRAFT_6102 [Paraphoma chrysanthemicola]|uniref:C2H2-type domain-containing protein n=1 Tax=Paraphoma chrysanthemicola TaxID=798071 RepID=A0A8K0W3F1_9PLEO|nr:hypothetical protein FB567DRAFT_6102 [Paraphoma chrysanthemicola]